VSTPVEEIRAAAARLRDTRGCDNHRLDSDSRELLALVRVLLQAREPLVPWLDDAATVHARDSECGYCMPGRNPLGLPCPALATARAINATPAPGPLRGGQITDRLSDAAHPDREENDRA